MATLETQVLDEVIVSGRRKLLTLGGTALAGLAFAGVKANAQAAAYTDSDILNFALNLEYLEAQFYSLVAFGKTIDKLPTPIPVAVNGGTAGTVTLKAGFTQPVLSSLIASYAMETAIEEGKHVKFLQGALSTKAVSMPNIDLYNSFNALAAGAGVNATFDPFGANGSLLTADQAFLIGAYIFEDVGVSAYHGAAGLITDKVNILPAAVGIHAVEAYHAGLVRTAINQQDAGTDALNSVTRKISAFRAKLANPSGTPIDDVGITNNVMVALNGSAATYPSSTIVNADSNTIGWARTTSQILAIVTGTSPTAATHQGVFFPAGLNGFFK